MEKEILLANKSMQDIIYDIRGVRVMLDYDLATIYGVETRTLNQAVKRNMERFPQDFMFKLTEEEWFALVQKISEGVSKREAHPLFVPLFKEEMEVVFTQTSYKGNVF